MRTSRIKNRQPSSIRVHRKFEEFEDLQESVRDWDLDFRQLDRGPFEGEIHMITTPDVHLGHVRFDRRLEQAGTPPAGLRTIAVPADPGLRMHWRGRQVTGRQVVVYPQGSEIDAISQPGFEMYVLSFSPQVLLAAAERAGVSSCEALLDTSDVVDVDPKLLDALRGRLETWFARWASPATSPDDAEARRDLPTAVLSLLAGATPSRRATLALRMDRAIHMTRTLVGARPNEALRVGELCAKLGVSERTLRHAFRNRLGLTPKAYVRDRRLNLARHALRQGPRSAATISDIANHHGFWHMGQFAADYQRLFGELPSETLSRVGGTRSRPCRGAS